LLRATGALAVFHITSFWRCCRELVFQHKAIWAFVTLLDFVVCFFLMLSFMQFVYICLCFPLVWFVLNSCLRICLRAWCSCWKVLRMGFQQPNQINLNIIGIMF